jgi:hypothetical protein
MALETSSRCLLGRTKNQLERGFASHKNERCLHKNSGCTRKTPKNGRWLEIADCLVNGMCFGLKQVHKKRIDVLKTQKCNKIRGGKRAEMKNGGRIVGCWPLH